MPIFKSPLAPSASPRRCSPTAFIIRSAAEPVAGGQPVSMMQNISDDHRPARRLSGAATMLGYLLVTPATGPALSTTTSNVQ
eukprot:7381631-Prymnesium_polylepis.1